MSYGLAAVVMPHVYDNGSSEFSDKHYADILKQSSQKENERERDGDCNSYALSVIGSVTRETRKNSTSSDTQPKAKKRLKKSNVLPKLVEHLKIKDRSNSVPVLFPPIPRTAASSQLWTIEDEEKLRSAHLDSNATEERKAAVTGNVTAKMKLPIPPKFTMYRKLGAKGGENFYKAPEKLIESQAAAAGTDRKRPGHSVTQEKRKAGLSRALAQSYNNFNNNFPPVMDAAAGEDSISVRKKIQQFRRWHEEQYKEKLAKLTAENEKQKMMDKSKMIKWNSMDELDRADKIKGISIEFTSREPVANEMTTPFITIHDDPIRLGRVVDAGQQRPVSPPARVPSALRDRPVTATTWKTWRGADESDAYHDVNKYIAENELMPDERRKHIENWVLDVERCRPRDNQTESQPQQHSTESAITK